MADKKAKEEKTPMQQAELKIKTAYIAAFFSAVLTFVLAVASLFADFEGIINIFAIVDVIIVFILAVLLVTIKSRIAAVILLAYYLLNQISMIINNPQLGGGNIGMMIVFTTAYFQGIRGTIAYHKLRKEEKDQHSPYN